MTKKERLFADAVSLPFEIRAQLVEALLLSLNQSDTEIDEAWALEAERRAKEIREGKVKTIPGEDVFRKIRARLKA